MTTLPKPWSELNPTTKLRDVRFKDGIFYATVEETFLPALYVKDQFYVFNVYTVNDYRDHFFIVTGNNPQNKRYHYVKKETYERLEP